MATTITSISPDGPSEAIKMILAVIVEHAGGDFAGVQPALPEHRLPAYVPFNHPRHHSTPALQFDEHFSTHVILQRLADCEKKFEGHG